MNHVRNGTIYDAIDNCTTLRDLAEIEDEIDERVRDALRNGMVVMTPVWITRLLDAVERRRAMLDPDPFYCAPHPAFAEGESVNGYELWPTPVDALVLDKATYYALAELWTSDAECSRSATFDEFFAEFDKQACSDWSQMDRYGAYCGGYWAAPEGSYERVNAYELTRVDNARALWELPYPKSVVLKTVQVGCHTHRESVRFSNYLCQYVARKRALVGQFQELSIKKNE